VNLRFCGVFGTREKRLAQCSCRAARLGGPIPLRAAQQDDCGIVFLRAFATKLFDRFHEPRDAAIMRGHKVHEACTSELLIFAIQGFGNPVRVEEQTEVMAELHRVFRKLTGKQAEWHAGVSMERANVASMAEQGPRVAGASKSERSTRRIQHCIDHGDILPGRNIIEQHPIDAREYLAWAARRGCQGTNHATGR
jgi:hypothetical protein